MQDLILLGIQGSGKGTQARLLCQERGYFYFEAGAKLREIAASQSTLGQKVAEIINQGRLVPAPILMEMVEQFCKDHPQKPILFDGVPRNLEQFELFGPLMEKFQRSPLVIHLKLAKEKAIERILKRARESKQKRKDDTPQIIKERIEIFYQQTQPIIKRYQTQKNLVEIDAMGEIKEINRKILQSIDL